MGWIYHDPDEWETVTKSEYYGKDPLGTPLGSFSVGYKKRSPEDIAKIKAFKLKEYEDAVLAEAEVILAKRKLHD